MGGVIATIIGLAVGYLAAFLALLVMIRLFGIEVENKDLAIVVLIMQLVGLFTLIPFLGWIIALVLNIVIMQKMLECSFLAALLGVILWGILQGVILLLMAGALASVA